MGRVAVTRHWPVGLVSRLGECCHSREVAAAVGSLTNIEWSVLWQKLEAEARRVVRARAGESVSTRQFGARRHQRLRQLEHKIVGSRKMVADRHLEIEVLKEIARKSGRRTRALATGRACWTA